MDLNQKIYYISDTDVIHKRNIYKDFPLSVLRVFQLHLSEWALSLAAFERQEEAIGINEDKT